MERFIKRIRNRATAVKEEPITGSILYLPVLLTTWPEIIEPIIIPRVKGRS